nr:recombinase family protein [Brevibacillus laterosporus]
MAVPKRVAGLYRVSTKKQVDKDDIPLQRRVCREFVDKQEGWTMVKEYAEKGVSGYKVAAKDRDELQRILTDAKNGLFDVLLVFLSDRLGRQGIKTLGYVQELIEMGIEIWSTEKGRITLDDLPSLIMATLEFGTAKEESRKISVRVSASHEQMAKDGAYRGGTPPFGYKHEKTGFYNKKGKELLKLVQCQEESLIIKDIFNMVFELGYGANRIARYLNEKKVPTRKSSNWSTGTLNTILKNPIYKGYMAYGKRSAKTGSSLAKSRDKWILPSKPEKSLIIINEEIWDRVQDIRTKRSPEHVKREGVELVNPTKSPLMFVGLIRCGHCGSAVTTTYNYKSWTLADGTIQKKCFPKYRCSGKALRATNCDGQTIYSQNKIEGYVLKHIEKYLNGLKSRDLTSVIEKRKKINKDENTTKLNKLQKLLEEVYQELSVLNAEVPKALMGKSNFKPELLSNLIVQKEEEIVSLSNEILEVEKVIKCNRDQTKNIEMIQSYIPKWSDIFESASLEKKKMMVFALIERITVYRDKIRIKFKPQLDEILKGEKEVYNNMLGTPS